MSEHNVYVVSVPMQVVTDGWHDLVHCLTLEAALEVVRALFAAGDKEIVEVSVRKELRITQ